MRRRGKQQAVVHLRCKVAKRLVIARVILGVDIAKAYHSYELGLTTTVAKFAVEGCKHTLVMFAIDHCMHRIVISKSTVRGQEFSHSLLRNDQYAFTNGSASHKTDLCHESPALIKVQRCDKHGPTEDQFRSGYETQARSTMLRFIREDEDSGWSDAVAHY